MNHKGMVDLYCFLVLKSWNLLLLCLSQNI